MKMNDDVMFNAVGKKLPYSESEEYVNGLIERCADRVLNTPVRKHAGVVRTVWLSVAGAAAAVAVVATVASGIFKDGNDSVANTATMSQKIARIECNSETVEQSSSLDEVLTGMTDDQLALISYYPTDDIPEY